MANTRISLHFDDDDVDASSEASIDRCTSKHTAHNKAARPRRASASQNKPLKALFVSGCSSEDSAEGEEGIGEGPIEETTATAPDGSVIRVTYRGVDPSLPAGSKEWKKAKRLADNRASAARSRALQRLKVGDLGKQLDDIRATNEFLLTENARLKALLAAHGLADKTTNAQTPQTTSKVVPAKQSKQRAATMMKVSPAVSRVDSMDGHTTATGSPFSDCSDCFSSPLSGPAHAPSDAYDTSPSALLPLGDDADTPFDFSVETENVFDLLPLPALRETSMAAEMNLCGLAPAPIAASSRSCSLFAGFADLFSPVSVMPSMASPIAGGAFSLAAGSRCMSSGSIPAELHAPVDSTVSGVKRQRVSSSSSCGLDAGEDEDAVEVRKSKRARGASPFQLAMLGIAVCIAVVSSCVDPLDGGSGSARMRGRLLLSHDESLEADDSLVGSFASLSLSGDNASASSSFTRPAGPAYAGGLTLLLVPVVAILIAVIASALIVFGNSTKSKSSNTTTALFGGSSGTSSAVLASSWRAFQLLGLGQIAYCTGIQR